MTTYQANVLDAHNKTEMELLNLLARLRTAALPAGQGEGGAVVMLKHAVHEIVFEERWCRSCGTINSHSNIWAICLDCGEDAEGWAYRQSWGLFTTNHPSDDKFHESASGALMRLQQ